MTSIIGINWIFTIHGAVVANTYSKWFSYAAVAMTKSMRNPKEHSLLAGCKTPSEDSRKTPAPRALGVNY